jgi:hypothetical protein
LRRKLELRATRERTRGQPADDTELLAALPRFERNLQARQKELDAMPPALLAPPPGPLPTVPRAIMAGADQGDGGAGIAWQSRGRYGLTAIICSSTRAWSLSAATCTVARAGWSAGKTSRYTALNVAKSSKLAM